MNETMYEVNYHNKNDKFSHCTVNPITIIRESILPGCTSESITAIDNQGHRFQGSRKDYFVTETLAWDTVKKELEESIQSINEHIVEQTEERDRIQTFLNSLQKGEAR